MLETGVKLVVVSPLTVVVNDAALQFVCRGPYSSVYETPVASLTLDHVNVGVVSFVRPLSAGEMAVGTAGGVESIVHVHESELFAPVIRTRTVCEPSTRPL